MAACPTTRRRRGLELASPTTAASAAAMAVIVAGVVRLNVSWQEILLL